jgi:ribonuclease HI
VADFMAEHMITIENDVCMVETIPWRLFFDGSVCNKGQGIGCVVVSPTGGVHELSARLEFVCTNNQAEYGSLLHGLEFLVGMGVKEVEAMGDSSLVVQKIREEHQCLNGVLNRYRDKCLDLLKLLGTFCIRPISREENQHASDLAQQASGYEVRQGMFMIKQNPMMALGTLRVMIRLSIGLGVRQQKG